MNRAKTKAAAGALTASVVLAGCGQAAQAPEDAPAGTAPADGLTRIVQLAAERAAISDDVAAAKFGTGKPVTDQAREAVVIESARADAKRDGVDPEWVEHVIADQIVASTQVQHDLLRQWADHPETRPAGRPDLTKVRPGLDRIGDEMIAALKAATPTRSLPDCSSSLAAAVDEQAGRLDEVHRAALDRALISVCTVEPK